MMCSDQVVHVKLALPHKLTLFKACEVPGPDVRKEKGRQWLKEQFEEMAPCALQTGSFRVLQKRKRR
jgi:hypothetical protein